MVTNEITQGSFEFNGRKYVGSAENCDFVTGMIEHGFFSLDVMQEKIDELVECGAIMRVNETVTHYVFEGLDELLDSMPDDLAWLDALENEVAMRHANGGQPV